MKNTINQKIEEKHINGIEALRAFAALMIVIFHTIILVQIKTPEHFEFIKLYFDRGVPLFYVLSGFVLMYGYQNKLTDKPSIEIFYIKRYFRIAPLFYSLLILWIIIQKIKYGNSTSLESIIINITLLFGLSPEHHQSIVWAGWSIGVEFLFYLIFPLLALIIRNIKTSITFLAISILISSSFYNGATLSNFGSYAYKNIITHMPHFLSGITAFLIWKKTGFIKDKNKSTILLITCITLIAITTTPEIQKFITSQNLIRIDQYIWSIIFLLLILSTCLHERRIITNKITLFAGKISFSLYLIHPIVIATTGDLYWESRKIIHSDTTALLLYTATVIILTTATSAITYSLIEKNGMLLGNKIIKHYKNKNYRVDTIKSGESYFSATSYQPTRTE